jgi:hypothetical protein
MGPILIFDKSTLESLNIDEAVWLDVHYLANITPLFFVETLADLEKDVDGGRTPEQVVGYLARKTPEEGQPNVHHANLCLHELLGGTVEMSRRIILAGGRFVESEGRRGVVFEESPEMAALSRWTQGKFLEVERGFSRAWRKALSGLDLPAMYREGKEIIERYGRPRDLAEAKTLAEALHAKPGSHGTRRALGKLPIPKEAYLEAVERWRAAGEPPIGQFAPYTAHVLTVDSFFTVALGADLISRDRPSNKVDIAYLYYLPFCMVFTSSDNLHARTAPLFLKEDEQVFIRGQDLKTDLARLDAHYSALPDEVKERGVLSFAHYPPVEGEFLTSKVWDKLMKPDWREDAKGPGITLSEKQEKELIAHVNRMARAAPAAGEVTSDETQATIVERRVPARKGKWRLVPPEVEEGSAGEHRED